jgi:hypothetical protein
MGYLNPGKRRKVSADLRSSHEPGGKHKEVTTQHENINEKSPEQEEKTMTRGPRPHRAIGEAVPIAKARGIVQMAMSGPERIFDIAIISKIPVTFSRVMFAPEILATIQDLAEYYQKEIAQLRVIARDAAITAELWLRSKHGTWRFFRVTPNSLVEIDRDGTPVMSGQTLA